MTQRRAVLVAGWSELDSILSEVEVPPELLIVQHAPHDWLLPRWLIIYYVWCNYWSQLEASKS
jgi:hypothetical protein